MEQTSKNSTKKPNNREWSERWRTVATRHLILPFDTVCDFSSVFRLTPDKGQRGHQPRRLRAGSQRFREERAAGGGQFVSGVRHAHPQWREKHVLRRGPGAF